jgi:hypothetical protein
VRVDKVPEVKIGRSLGEAVFLRDFFKRAFRQAINKRLFVWENTAELHVLEERMHFKYLELRHA